MEEDFKDLKIEENYDVNILLLGETGVGKSTFINSIANYLHHQDLKIAMEQELFYLIPCMFNVTDENYRPQKVIVGSDDNEYQLVGDSATQDVRTYVFPIGTGKTRLRLIDSPGMGDPRGVEQDDINCENILSYIGQLHHLHAICLLFRPNDARITITFEYCVKQILSRLDKSAAKNIIFVFTNSKATNYKPGETIACLKKVVEDIKSQPPHVEIKVDDNVFCFDNEAFRFLAASKKGIEFGEATKQEYFKSWRNSSLEAWKLIKYIVGDVGKDPLVPHMVKSSKCVNEARRIINQLAQPLADISQLILDNLQILDRRRKELQEDNLSLEKLREKLYVPVINLQVIKLTQPATVCCDSKCAEFVLVDGRKSWNYKQRCHDPCYLKNVPQEIIGAPQLEYCASMDRTTMTCKKCRCSQTVHMHIYYMTKKFDDKKIDTNIQSQITTHEKGLAEAERLVQKISKRKSELEDEKNVIIDCAAKFAGFLKRSAITPFNDAYRKYINYMILREQSLGRDADIHTIHHFENLLIKYDQIKMTFDKIAQSSDKTDEGEMEATEVQTLLNKLYSLKHNGKKIKELYSTQKTARKKEYQNTEYVHSSPVKPQEKEKLQTQSDVEGKTKKNKQDKMNKNYHQHGVHKNKTPQKNLNKNIFQNAKKKDNITTSIVTDAKGTKKQIKIEINETAQTKPKNKNANQQGNTKLFVLNNRKSLEKQNPQSQRFNNPPPPYSNQPFNPPGTDRRDGNQPSRRGYNSDDNRAFRDNRPPYDGRPPYENQPPHDYRPPYDSRPPYDYRPPHDNRPHGQYLPPYDNRPPSDYRPPPQSDYRPPPSDYRPPPSDYRPPPPSDCRPPPSDYRPPPTSDYRPPPPSDYRPPPPSDYRPHDNPPPHDYPPRGSSYDARPPFDGRATYDPRPPYDTRPPYDSRPPYDNRPPYDYRPPQGESPYFRPYYQNRPHDGSSQANNCYDQRSQPNPPPPPYDRVSNNPQRRRRRKNNGSGTDSFKSCDDSD